jgi:hypothetical protein
LDEHTCWDSSSSRDSFGKYVGDNIIVSWDVLKLDSLEVAFEFANLSAISIHRVDAKGHCYAKPVDQGFVLCTVVGGLVVDL